MFLMPEALLKYLPGEDKLHTLITAKNTEVELITTDQCLYESLGSIKDRSEIDVNLLVKLLEVVTVKPHTEMMHEDRKILTEERVLELRKNIAEKNKKDN